MPKLLLHVCCGPCASYPVPALRAEGFELRGYYFNPNIHPYTEWQKRRDSLLSYAQAVDLPMLFEEEYDPAQYFQTISFRESRRCFYCYQLRLEKAAQIARKGKFDGFTTTLLVSKYQRHDWIQELGQLIGEKYEIPFIYRDFRDGFRQTGINAREMGLYRQQYCGCLYSEMERYRRKAK